MKRDTARYPNELLAFEIDRCIDKIQIKKIKFLYTGDLDLIAESQSELGKQFQVWKQGLKLKSLRVDLAQI